MTVTIECEDQATDPEKERQSRLHDAQVATGELICSDRTHNHSQPYVIA
jgi:hypothetical protein